ncbi:MAG TPA: beta-galactosidase [Bryobacteraceae bacterium]|nr:beta-galactosidase [Bryobacteraceae bacterium]
MTWLLIAFVFPVSVWYGGGKARAPMLEDNPRAKKEVWRRDVQAIRQTGFNAIRGWIDWASAEPGQGKYNFETLDVLLDLAREEGLKFIVQVYMDSAPDWVGVRFPDSLYTAAGGARITPEAAPGYCRDHPGVREREIAFFSALAKHMGKHPAFLGWDLWSEPHVINWANATWMPNAEYCFCPRSVARFRAWLKHKYNNLDALNAAWYRRFTTWDQVEPNRLSTILSYTDYIDWRTFIQHKLGEDLRDRYKAVKQFTPGAVATSHAAAPSLFTSPLAGDGSPDDWIMRREVDFYGTSFYPKHSYPVGRDPAWRGALLDFAKSSGYADGRNGFWIGELQSGFGTVALNVSGTVTAADITNWMWSTVSRGAKAVNVYAWYPMSTGYESGGYGLIQLDGTLTDRSKAAGDVARAIAANSELFERARPPQAELAIVYNPLNYFVGGRQRAASNYGPQSEVAGIERDAMLGLYRALFPLNVPVDFVHVQQLSAAGLNKYKLVYVPYPLMLPESAAAALRGYMGKLVLEARAGWNTDAGRASEVIPGMGLHELVKARESAVQSIPGSRTELIWESLLARGTKTPARLYEETLEPLSPEARVVARFADGRPAAIMTDRTLMLGSYVSPVAETPFAKALLDWAQITAPVSVNGASLEVRTLESGSETLVFVFNHTSASAAAGIALNRPRVVWSETLPPNGVSVFRIAPDGRRTRIAP